MKMTRSAHQYDGRFPEPAYEAADDIKAREIAAAVAAERERCAQVCERLGNTYGGITRVRLIEAAAAIRREPQP